MNPSSPSPVEQLRGVVQHLTYVNQENGYFVARVAVPGKGERMVTGHAPSINVGEQITVKGEWTSKGNYGPQFKAVEVTLSQPTMVDGIEKYLANAVPGIGKGYAKKMVTAFGEDVFDVIEKTPEKLGEVKGIGKKRAASIVEAYAEQQSIRKVMVFLHKCGLSTLRAHKIHKTYESKGGAIAAIKENPYVLARDIHGIGFAQADAVAQRQGVTLDSEYRIAAGVHHVLREASGHGSCGLPVATVLEQASALLDQDYALIKSAIANEVQAERLIEDTSDGEACLFTPTVYGNEKYIAQRLLAHARLTPSHKVDNLDLRLMVAQMELEIELEDAQLDAVRAALLSQFIVITGGPGTGKTTITKVLLKVLEDSGMKDIRLTAPTGKAAKRAAESSKREAGTLHRTLEVQRDGTFKFNKNNPLPHEALVIDEFSMVDVGMMASVLNALAAGTRLILIGDVDQLPSVGMGKVLADIIDSGALPVVRLTQIFRQAATSQIIANAHAINRGELPRIGYREGSDFMFTDISPKKRDDEEEKRRCNNELEAEILRLVKSMRELGYNPIRDVQVLAPMRKGILGVENLNRKLQAMLNPRPADVIELMGQKWGTGDKVMQIRNNYDKEVFNGDIGYIVSINPVDRSFVVDYDGKDVAYKSGEIDEIVLAYAFTIHKSQGSEFKVVVMALAWGHFTMLKRNLFYTGVTRGKELCLVVGQVAAAKKAVETAQNDERYTKLKDWLRASLPVEMARA
jgi:exodeoxyribonuclease V alpha subunit